MLEYNIATSFRSLTKNLSFSIINIAGLSLSLSLAIILIVWLKFEFSFDRFNTNADRIFRVVTEFKNENHSDNFAGTPAPLGTLLKNDISDISDYVRIGRLGRCLVNYKNQQFWEDIDVADPSVFKIFSFKLLTGDPEKVLNDPGSVVISETTAGKYFRNENPVGRTLLIGESGDPYIVTGIMKDIPANSQLQFEFLISFSTLKNNIEWGIWNYSTYLLAKNSKSYKTISQKLPEVVKKIPRDDKFQLHLQRLTSIHLHSFLRSDIPTNRNIKSIYIVSSILVLVMFMACINYMNIATARYSKKGTEACLRKITGASNSDLVGQFLCESFAITFIAFISALFIVYLLIPIFTAYSGIQLSLKSLFDFDSIFILLIFLVLISLIAGSYPAFIFSSVNPTSTLRDDFKLTGIITAKGLRKGLVIFQFCISIILIASTLVIKSQMSFIKNKNLGLNPEQVIAVPIYQSGVKPKYELFKKEILTSPYILNASAVNYTPGAQGFSQNVWWEGLPLKDKSNVMDWIPADQDFPGTLNIEMSSGEFFQNDIYHKNSVAYVLNEVAAEKIGWADPIGKKFDIVGMGNVVGIVKNFNFKSLHNDLEPVALAFYPDVFDKLLIKISTEDIPGTIAFINNKWNSLFPEYPFEYSFLSDDFQKMYKNETAVSAMVSCISIIALFISCIGLFGLVLFTTDNRIKEIGIRKVAGSSSVEVVMMIDLEFIKWITISFVISCPIVVFCMNKWLENFAYRIHLTLWTFLAAGTLTVLISLITVSWHTWYAATRNPLDCLRHE